MRTNHVALNKCSFFPDGRVAKGRNGWFHPIAISLFQDDAFVFFEVASTRGTPITIWFNVADARRLGEALISIMAGDEQHD